MWMSDHNMLAAYGVYAPTSDHEEGGFGPSSHGQYYPEHVVVVTSQRDGSTTNSLVRSTTVAGGWCWCKSADSSSVDSPWYKPAVLLIVIALLLIVFLLVSGILVYFNREYNRVITKCYLLTTRFAHSLIHSAIER